MFAAAEGFDPAALPEAVKEAGFTSPETELSLVVRATGTVAAEGETLSLDLPGTRWQLTGDRLIELKPGTRVRVTGAFTPAGEVEQFATLRVLSAEPIDEKG